MLVKYEYPQVAFHGSGFAAAMILCGFVICMTKITRVKICLKLVLKNVPH